MLAPHGSDLHVPCARGAVVPDGNGVVKEVLVAQVFLCLAAQVALHLVFAQLVSEVVCVHLALLCWIGSAPEEVASEPGSASHFTFQFWR